MDKPKHKDGMLAAGKKRLEQFRQKKNKGSSSKQTKQETDIEHGRSSTEVENASQTSSKAKSSTFIDDSEGSRKHTLYDDQDFANTKFDDGSKEFLIHLNTMRSGDDASRLITEQSSASDFNNSSAHASHTAGNALEHGRVTGEKTQAIGNEEVCLKIDLLDSSQLQPSSSPYMTDQVEKPIEQASLDPAGAPDLSINMADLGAQNADGTDNVVNFEHGTSELNSESRVMKFPSGDYAKASYDKEQKSDLESCAAGIPSCLSTDNPAIIRAGMESEYGDEMQVSSTAEAMHPGSNLYSGPVLHSLESISGGNEVGTLQSGHDFDNTEAGIMSRLPSDSAVSVNVAQDAIKEEEPGISSESGAGSNCLNEPNSEPIVDVDTDVSTVLYSEVDSSPRSKIPNVENTAESHLKGVLMVSAPKETCNFEQQQTGELDVGCRVPLDSVLDNDGLSSNHGFKASENASKFPAIENDVGSFSEASLEGSVSHDICNIEQIQTAKLDGVLPDNEAVSLIDDHGHTESQNASYPDGMPVVLKEGRADIAGEVEKVLGGPELGEEKLESECNGSGELDQQRMLPVLSLEESVESDRQISVALSIDRSGGESCLEQEDLMSNAIVDRSPEEDIFIMASLGESGLLNVISDPKSGFGNLLDQEEGTVHAESSINNLQESCPGDNLRSFSSLEVVGAVQATEYDKLEISLTDSMVENASSLEANKLSVSQPLESEDHHSLVNSQEEMIVSDAFDQTASGSLDAHEAPILGLDSDGSDAFDQTAPGSLNAHEAPILGLDSDGKIDQGEVGNSEMVDVADVRVFDVSEMILESMADSTNVPGHNLENQEGTGPIAKESYTALIAHEEVAGEVSPEANIEDTGICPHVLAVDNSCLKPIDKPVGDACTGITSFDLEAATSGLGEECGLATVEPERASVTPEMGELKLELNGLSSFPGDQVKLIQGETVNVLQSDLETNITKTCPSSLDVEETSKYADHVELTGTCSQIGQEPLGSFKLDPIMHSSSTSKLEILPEFVMSSESPSLIASPGDLVAEAPILMNTNEASEGDAFPRSFSEDLDTDVSSISNRDISITPLSVGLESKGFDKLSLPSQTTEVAHDVHFFDNSTFSVNSEAGFKAELRCKDESRWHNSEFSGSSPIEVTESMESENMIRELQDSLSIKETELESITALLNSEAAKNFEERNKFIEVLMHIVKGLGHLVPRGLNGNEGAGLHFQLLKAFDADTTGLINLDQVIQNYDCWMDEMQKDLEERRKMETTLVEMTKAVEERANMDGKLKQLQDVVIAKQIDIERISDSMVELSQKYELTLAETAKVLEDKVNLEGDLKHFQNLYIEQESKANHLEELLLVKDTDLDTLQRLYAEERERYWNMSTQVNALAGKVTALMSPGGIEFDGDDSYHVLETLVTALHDQYEAISSERKDLLLRVSESDAYEMEVKTLRALVSEKEVEMEYAQDRLDSLAKELSQTKEEGERKLLEAEQKALGVRERLSLAVTKGKGLVQQRDNLKQLLAEKTAELEALTSSYQQELHAMTVALNEAEHKAKLNSEAGERVEALESELSYIRNSANALRESFLQKDAVLQKIEELLEDASLPEELQLKDTYEKVEWLLEASSQKTSTSEEGTSEIVSTTRGLNSLSIAEQTSQTQEIEQLNKKYDELIRKYRGMAEQSAMLEQSLLERNLLIQRWEEMLDSVDMPTTLKSKEPEDKIQWLGTAVSDAHNSIAELQVETHSLQTTIDSLSNSIQKLQEQNSVLSAEVMAKEDQLRAVALDLEDMTMKFNDLSKPTSESSNEACQPATAGTRDFEVGENNQEESQEQQSQIENSDAFVRNIRMLLSEVLQEDEINNMFVGVSTSIAFESSVKLLVDNSKVWFAEATDAKEKLTEFMLIMRKNKEDEEKEIKSLHEALSSKMLELSNLNTELEDFATKITFLENEVDQLQKEVKVKTEELAFVRDELNKSQLESSQGEEKLASVREKLSMAVRKGKSVVQQRDILKQSLEAKIAELDQLRKEHEAESLALTKAKQSFKHQLQQLEAELTSSRNYATSLEKSLQENNKVFQKFGESLDKIATSGAPRSGDLMEKIQWISQLVLDLQRKAGINEQEAKKSKKATELLALELEEVQGRMDSLTDELMHAEKNISTLIEEKKLAEASKAEAGLRLEHAMANINSLLFELSESKEALTNMEQENSSLKDSLSAQMEEIRLKHAEAEDRLKELTDLYNKVHALRANQSTFLGKVADEMFKLTEGMRGTQDLIIRISGELKEQSFITFLPAPAFVEKFPLKWEPEFSNKGKTTQEWKQGITTGSLRLLCEEMEIEFQNFDTFFNNLMMALNQDSAALSNLLSEVCNGVGSLTEKLETVKRDADFASSTESLILEKDEQIRILEEVLKKVAERLRASFEEVEGFREKSWELLSRTSISAPVATLPSAESLQNITVSLVETLSSSAKDLVQSYHHSFIQSEKQIEELKGQLKEAKEEINAMGQQQQIDKLKFQKRLEEFEGKDDILRRANQELCSMHDILAAKKQEEKGHVEALEKAEMKVQELSAKVEELEKAKQELEASLGKASSRFYATVNNFNKFQSLSEKLIEEAESLHLLLEDRDAQISLLKDEVAHKESQFLDLQNLVNERTTDLSEVYQQIGGIINRDGSGVELLTDAGKRKEMLEALATSVRAGTESLRVQLARKDALLQDVQLRHDDLTRKVLVLESTVQENQRLMEEREHMMITVEAEEKGNRGKHATPSAALVTHSRGGRKVPAAAEHLALDVDTESGRLLADVDDEDKGHVFKPLTSSRLVPRGTRILVDRLDGFWVSGERLMRRRPGARLSVMLYWLVLHIWIVATLL